MKTNDMIILFIFIFSFISVQGLSAQEPVADGYEQVDSVIYRLAATVDSTLVGKDVFYNMPSKAKGDNADVNIEQNPLVEQSVRAHIIANKERNISGYRVRIFFDNKQTSRTESEDALKRFQAQYRDIPAYRTYANPYFKVTVGDFRTKSEAMEFLGRIRTAFPSAFVVKENISYPVVDKDNALVADTVKVIRPKMIENKK